MAKERPILFSGEMVKAILDGRKTQTRRVIDLQPEAVLSKKQRDIGFTCSPEHSVVGDLSWVAHLGGKSADAKALERCQQINVPIRHPDDKDPWEECPRQRLYCPHGAPGDRLWVRETWRAVHDPGTCLEGALEIDYAADGRDRIMDRIGKGKWKPSIHMPRWASRITLEIAEVRVQRVQEISEEDAKAEGVEATYPPGVGPAKYVLTYRNIWDSLNTKRGYGWSANPWVWAITFKRLETP